MTSPTSLNALASAKRRAPRQKDRILHAFRSFADSPNRGMLTDEDLSGVLGLSPSTCRPRRIELVAEGLIVDSGRTRKTKSGHDAALWRLATAEEREAFEAKRADRELESLAQAVADAQRNLNALRERWRQAIEEGARRAEVRT